MADTADEKKKPAFQPKTLQAMEYVAKQYILTVPADATPDDILDPARFAHVASKLRKNSLILVVSEGETWTGLFRVYSVGDTWAKVHVCWVSQHEELGADAAETPPEFRYKIDRNQAGYRVIHKETGKVIASKIATKGEAEARMQAEIDKSK